MLSLPTVEDALKQIIVVDGATYNFGTLANTPYDIKFDYKKWLIVGLGTEYKSAIGIKVVGAGTRLRIDFFSLGDGTVIQFTTKKGLSKVMFVPNTKASKVAAERKIHQSL